VTVSPSMLLARLHVESLIPEVDPAGVKRVLQNLPKDLESVFSETMERIRKQTPPEADLAHRILLWVIGAKRPLEITELQHATAIREDKPYFDQDRLPTTNLMKKVCAGLIVVEGKVVRVTRMYSHFQSMPI
jgi:hypothetical protein